MINFYTIYAICERLSTKTSAKNPSIVQKCKAARYLPSAINTAKIEPLLIMTRIFCSLAGYQFSYKPKR